jgi:hypothetical protein
MRASPNSTRFSDLRRVCEAFFGHGRQHGSSHLVFDVPAAGAPPVSIPEAKGKAKPYQVKQVLAALDLLRK